MAIVNKKLGNGFVFRDADSPRDQEQYFSGASKVIKLRWNFFSGSCGGLDASHASGSSDEEFELSGAVGIEFSRSLYTSSDASMIDGDARAGFGLEPSWFSGVFGAPASGSAPDVPMVRNIVFSCLVKRVSGSFDSSEFDVLMRDPNFLADFNTVKQFGNISKYDDDWRRVVINFAALGLDFSDSIVGQDTILLLSASENNAYAFKNVRFDFFSYLTDTGVKHFRERENQNFEFEYINPSVMPKIEDSLRNISYYGWENAVLFESDANNTLDAYYMYDLAIDSNDVIYACGYVTFSNVGEPGWVVLRSLDKGDSWEIVDLFYSGYDACVAKAIDIDPNTNAVYVCGNVGTSDLSYTPKAILRKSVDGSSGSFYDIDSLPPDPGDWTSYSAVAVDISGSVFVVGQDYISTDRRWIVRKSTDGSSGSFDYIDVTGSTLFDNDGANGIVADYNTGAIYVAGQLSEGSFSRWLVRKSNDGSSGSFYDIDRHRYGSNTSNIGYDMDIDRSNGSVYVCGYTNAGGDFQGKLRKSDDGTSGSFYDVTHFDATSRMYDVAVDSTGGVYACGYIVDGSDNRWFVKFSPDGSSGSFAVVDNARIYNASTTAGGVKVDSEDFVYLVGLAGNKAVFRKGKLRYNYDSIGPSFLAESIGYVESELLGTTNQKFKLMNISEFPHSMGIFQMPNMILGTRQYGKIGNSEDDLIQINHIGSVVHIFWPNQKNVDSLTQGVGSFSAGQKPGKLSTTFEPGTFLDVTKYDHLSLFCYVDVAGGGTTDDVLIKIEKRPLRDAEFTVNQAVEYEVSGNYVEATYRDVIHRKEIDYSAAGEINWNIDIPIENAKEIRISVRHKNGQAVDENKNFIVWGRLIKSSEET